MFSVGPALTHRDVWEYGIPPGERGSEGFIGQKLSLEEKYIGYTIKA